jgi:hypothetical protein
VLNAVVAWPEKDEGARALDVLAASRDVPVHALACPHAVITSRPGVVVHDLENDRVKQVQDLLGKLFDKV